MTQDGSAKVTRDVYERVTASIIAAIEAGAGTFEMPWHRSGNRAKPVNAHTKKPYRGVNIVALWASAEIHGYHSGTWATYKQWKELGAQVRKGEKASLVVFYKEIEREATDGKTGETELQTYLMARASWVFSVEQVDGWEAPRPEVRDPVEIVEHAERFVSRVGADIRHGGDRAYYVPSADHIQVPHRDRFSGTSTSSATESYYATLLHELTHWTGHKTRLNRDMANRFGDQAYAMEELVAELGAAFLCADLGVTNAPRSDHAAYIASWLQVLKSDKKAIFTAASKASQAAEYLTELQSTRMTHATSNARLAVPPLINSRIFP